MIETIPKYQRILELKQLGFNVPKTLYINPVEPFDKTIIQKFLSGHSRYFVNFRTYRRNGEEESWNSKHYMFIKVEKAVSLAKTLHYSGTHVMIDLENPCAGLYAGSVQIVQDAEESFVLDYCYDKAGSAVVRNVDMSVSGSLSDSYSLLSVPRHLQAIVKSAFHRFALPYYSVILEWTVTSEAAGELEQNTVWWEYRNLKKEA